MRGMMSKKRHASPASNSMPVALAEWFFALDTVKWVGAFLMGVAALAWLMVAGMMDDE